MAEYILHCWAQSGHSYKVALMLELCGADWKPHWVDFFNGETRSEEFRSKYNEMGEVPILETKDLMLTQSAVILDYLVEKFRRFGWTTEDERREILRWTVYDNQKVSGVIASLRFMRSISKVGETEVVKSLDARAKIALAVLEKRLWRRDFVIGDGPTTADFSLCSYLFYDGELGIDLADYPEITNWLERIRSLPGWKHPYDLMLGHPLPDAI